MQGIPTTEVFIAPIENSVEGKIVVDASLFWWYRSD
jgi:leucyl aminopeptidase (aminopeptidase T)